MHEVEVKVINSKIFQRGIASFLNIINSMTIIPQLCDDEDFFSGNATGLDGFTDSWFSSIAWTASA